MPNSAAQETVCCPLRLAMVLGRPRPKAGYFLYVGPCCVMYKVISTVLAANMQGFQGFGQGAVLGIVSEIGRGYGWIEFSPAFLWAFELYLGSFLLFAHSKPLAF